jgi:hypothetical protein
MRRLLIALVVVLAVGAAALLGGRVLPRSDHRTRLFTASVSRLVVRVETGKVVVAANRQMGARLRVSERFSLHRPHLTSRLAGGVLRIDAVCRKPAVISCQVDIRLDVAPEVSIDAATGGGDIRVDNVAGRVTLRSAAGAVDVTGLTGDAVLRTSAGPVSGHDLAVSTLRAATAAGSIALRFAVAPAAVIATTGAGDVDLAVPSDSYRVTTSAPAGRARVDVPVDRDSSRTISATSGAGSVTVRAAAPM